jgi:hypothetical protein
MLHFVIPSTGAFFDHHDVGDKYDTNHKQNKRYGRFWPQVSTGYWDPSKKLHPRPKQS